MKKKYTALSADADLPLDAAATLPSLSRSWLILRSPLLHPFAAISLTLQWQRLKRELDDTPGMLHFEYRISLRPLMIGIHVLWDCHESEKRWVKSSSLHKGVARWALKSSYTPAMRIEHLVRDSAGAVRRLGGFVASEKPDMLPEGCCDIATPIAVPALR